MERHRNRRSERMFRPTRIRRVQVSGQLRTSAERRRRMGNRKGFHSIPARTLSKAGPLRKSRPKHMDVEDERRERGRRRFCLDLLITAAAVFVLFRVIAGIAVVQGDSMKPNLTNGSVILFYRLENSYKRNDIVILKVDGRKNFLVKRVAAVAGDRVDIDDKTGTLLVNGADRQKETMNGKTYTRDGGVTFPLTVPSGCIFVLGDNREAALDSRSFGAVTVDSLVGKVFFEARILKGGSA